MTGADRVFAGSIPEIYDRLLVPLIFSSYADDIAERVARLNPQRILETAAGTGVVTKALARKLPETVSIVATDLNQAMLDRTASTLRDARVVLQQADALKLPFDDQSFDVVVCQFGVMFFPDKVQGYREARRVLKPGGAFLFNVWNEIAKNEFADVITLALADVFPQDPPMFLARTPHGYHDIAKIRQHLAQAGFADISVETVGATARVIARGPRSRLLSGNASKERDRKPRCIWLGRGDPIRHARGGTALRSRSDRGRHQRACRNGTTLVRVLRSR